MQAAELVWEQAYQAIPLPPGKGSGRRVHREGEVMVGGERGDYEGWRERGGKGGGWEREGEKDVFCCDVFCHVNSLGLIIEITPRTRLLELF